MQTSQTLPTAMPVGVPIASPAIPASVGSASISEAPHSSQ
ncbi:uncharacterized protein METZ01_LOCUS173969, partial [marine metagenome]